MNEPIDLGSLIPIAAVPAVLPLSPSGKPVHVSAVHRWVDKGLRGVRLRVTAVGGRLHTSREWLRDFFDGVAAARGLAASDPPPPPRTPARREREVAQAAAACEAAGY